MRVGWEKEKLGRMGKYEGVGLKMVIRGFGLGNDLKGFVVVKWGILGFGEEWEKKGRSGRRS